MIAPGPWSTDPHGTGEMGSVYDAEGNMVCQVQPSPHLVDNPRAQNLARYAAAEALCAYPDLRAALERGVALIEGDTYPSDRTVECRAFLSDARAALSRGQ
jgi:hypothetical protein